MRQIQIGQSKIQASQLALGCMRMDKLSIEEAMKVIKTALDLGINFFDHADIYGQGKSEQIFGEAIKRLGVDRKDSYIQSNVG